MGTRYTTSLRDVSTLFLALKLSLPYALEKVFLNLGFQYHFLCEGKRKAGGIPWSFGPFKEASGWADPLCHCWVSMFLTYLQQDWPKSLYKHLHTWIGEPKKQNKFQKTELSYMVHSLGLKKETKYKTSFK